MGYAATIWPKPCNPCLPFACCFFLLHQCSHSIVQNRTFFFFAGCAKWRYPSIGPRMRSLIAFCKRVCYDPFSPPPRCILVFSHPVIQLKHHGKRSFSPVLHECIHGLVRPRCLFVDLSCTLFYFFPCATVSVSLRSYCFTFLGRTGGRVYSFCFDELLIVFFPVWPFHRPQRVYYVTASWVPYHKHYQVPGTWYVRNTMIPVKILHLAEMISTRYNSIASRDRP